MKMRRRHTLNVTSRLSPSSNTVDLTCLPSSIKVMPTYNETLSINLKTPSARITELLAASRAIAVETTAGARDLKVHVYVEGKQEMAKRGVKEVKGQLTKPWRFPICRFYI